MSDIEKRIDKLERTINELRNELRTLRVLVRTDYPSALNKIRFITEKILSQLCKEHDISWGKAEPTLENMIGPLTARNIIPRPIVIHVRSIQANSSPGSHFQESPLSSAHLEIAQMALVEFLEWYYSSHSSPDPIPVEGVHPSIQEDKIEEQAIPDERVSAPAPGSGRAMLIGLTTAILILGAALPIFYFSLRKPRNDNVAITMPVASSEPTAGKASEEAAVANIANLLTQSASNPRNKTLVDLCDFYQPRITAFTASNNFLKAINLVGEYQLAILRKNPAPSFDSGLFQSDSMGISCNMPEFAAWKQDDDPAIIAKSDSLKSMGVEYLLNLKLPGKEDHVGILCVDYESIFSRMGLHKWDVSDGQIGLLTRQMVGTFGQVTVRDTEKIGNLQVTRLHVDSWNPGMDVESASFTHNGFAMAIVCMSPTANQEANAARLESILHAITFEDNPEAIAGAEQIKKMVTQPNDVGQLLASVRGLALLGEYRMAARQLSVLVGAIALSMPAPVVDMNVAEDSEYGIKLKNPDPASWKLQSQRSGSINIISLSSMSATDNQSFTLAIVNSVLSLGPHASEIVGPDVDEAGLNRFLSGMGRPALLQENGVIASENFSKYRGLLSYQGLRNITPPAISPVVQMEVFVVLLPDYNALIMTLTGTPEQLTQEEAMLNSILELPATNAPAAAP